MSQLLLAIITVLILLLAWNISRVMWKHQLDNYKSAISISGNPTYLDPKPNGIGIWKKKDYSLTIMDNEVSPVQLIIPFALFTRVQNIRITEQAYYKKLKHLHTLPVSYDTSTNSLWIKTNSVNEAINIAIMAVKISEGRL